MTPLVKLGSIEIDRFTQKVNTEKSIPDPHALQEEKQLEITETESLKGCLSAKCTVRRSYDPVEVIRW